MLEEIYIKNIALIDNARIEFSEGFNVLTGESGSGKSLIAGALSLLKGNRGENNIIRTGEETAEVSGIFTINSDPELKQWLDAKGIEPEDNSLIIRRTLKTGGRGAITVKSVPLSRSELAELSSFLFDIHGQHEQHTLMSEERQRNLLDSFSGITQDVAEFAKKFLLLSGMKKRLSELELSEKERLREIDILKFTVSEIEEASIKPDEDEELENRHRMLAEHEKLFRIVEEVHETLASGQEGIVSRIRFAGNAMASASHIDQNLSSFSDRISSAFYELEDIAASLRDYILKDSYSPELLKKCEERLTVLHRLKKKYGPTAREVLQFLEKSVSRLGELENLDVDREELKKEIKIIEEEVLKTAARLSETRRKKAADLENQIELVLKSLGMPNVSFRVSVNTRKNEAGKPVCAGYGFDQIAFLISPNTGEPLKPVDQIASGGELSRIMLAIKSVLSGNDPVDSMLFDEIDSGIGGEVAVSIGYHLRKLSKTKQIICITHLASIAANADNHIKVSKTIEKDRTFTKSEKVESDSRILEIARMLSGDQKGDASLEHARVLLERKS